MGLDKARKMKTPKMPAGLDDKDLTKALAEFDKCLTPFMAALTKFDATLVALSNGHTALEAAVDKKWKDKALDAKKKDLVKELYTSVNGIKSALSAIP